MAELILKIKADLTKLKADVQKLMKEKFQIGVEGKRAPGAEMPSTEKGQKGVAGGIVKGVGLLAVIAGILKTAQPIMDLMKIAVSAMMFWILKGVKWFMNTFPILQKTFFGWVVEWIKNVWSAVVTWFKELWIKIKEIPAKIKQFFINLGNKIRDIWRGFIDKVKEIWGILVTKVVELKDKFVAKLTELKNKLVTKFTEFKQKIIELKDKLVEKFEEVRDKIKEKFDELKTKLIDIWDSIKSLPEKIWNFFSGLAQAIADKIRSVIPFIGGTTDEDVIIRPNGEVIRPHPQDTIIATKNPSAMGGSKTFNFYGVTPQEMINVIRRELKADINMAGRF